MTFFTFLPSFLFIFAGGPLVESTHGKLGFTAPLTGITAAVVGVIVNLAVFFALPRALAAGLAGRFDALSAVIGVVAGIALFRFKVGVIPVVLVAGGVGIAATFAGTSESAAQAKKARTNPGFSRRTARATRLSSLA